MKFKLDENFGSRARRSFTERGHDAVTVRDEGLASAPDKEVLGAACSEQRILVTMDQGFGNVLLFPPESTEGVAVICVPGRASLPLLQQLLGGFLDALEKKKAQGQALDPTFRTSPCYFFGIWFMV